MTEQAPDLNRQFLTTLANLGIASHRLDQIRDAARLHRQQLIGTSELYAVIEATDPVSSAGPAPATDRAAAVASCPGYETSPNPCRCPCYGCKHHCAAHNPDDTDLTEADIDRMMTDAVPVQIVTEPPATDRDALRERIVQVLRTTPSALGAENPQLGFPSHHQPGESGYLGWCALCVRDIDAIADAVLAVLPAPDQRAAVLLEAADHLDARAAEFTAAARKDPLAFVKGATDARYRTADCWAAAAAELRRLAGEAPQDEAGDEGCETGDMRTCTGACPVHGELPEQQPARAAQQDPTQDGTAFTAIRADELEATAIALEAQTCTCGCRRAADFLRQRAAVTRATTAVALPGQPETDNEAPVHAIPGRDDNGISPCCGRPPFEFRGERLTRDPAKVTCQGARP